MTLEALISLVTQRIDEYTEDIDGDPPVAPVGDIPEELKNSAKTVLRTAKRSSVLSVSKRDNDITIVNKTKPRGTIIPVPDDYIRFVSINMDGWMEPVNTWLDDTTKEYRLQKFERLRATVFRPKVFMIPYDTESKKAFEAFPQSESLTEFVYIPVVAPEAMPDEFTDAMCYDAAGRSLLTMRLPALADGAFKMSGKLLNELS